MKHTIRTILALLTSLAFIAAGAVSSAPAMADDTGFLPHLSPAEIPACYHTGLVIGGDGVEPCLQGLTGDLGDITFNWFCNQSNLTVDCGYETQGPGVVAWTNLLYSALDSRRATINQQSAQITALTDQNAAQARLIKRLQRRLNRLHHHAHHHQTRAHGPVVR